MVKKYLLPILAILGALFALVVVFWTEHKTPTPPILFPPPISPYTASIAAAGIIEASSRNISIGSPFNEIVTDIFVIEGDYVKKGDPLFQLDLRSLNARAESARASLAESLVALESAQTQFAFFEKLKDKCAVSQQQYQQFAYSVKTNQELVNVAKANIEVIEADIQRSTVRSPFDALVMQVNIHISEIAPTVALVSSQATLMLLGRVDPLALRIDIDEADVWRYKKGARATAFVRGNSHINFPIFFDRIEPYIIPKASFTGETTERVDTRVLQVLYTFDWGSLPVFPGQILDIFIESDPLFEPKKEKEATITNVHSHPPTFLTPIFTTSTCDYSMSL